jgi:NADPH:quinone reductase-like Zn-dependent oxidoreductase
MKAIIWTAYGPPEVLKLREIEMPIPRADEVRIRVRATTVSAGDAELRGLKVSPMLRLPFRVFVGLDRPRRMKILGQELAGEIESAGGEVTRFKPGDRVFGTPGLRLGGYAEYACMPAGGALAHIPGGVSDEQAATLPVGGIEAQHFISQAQVKPGERILINGAGCCIGTYAVQLARNLGAEVTAVDSTPKLAMLQELGAQHVIDYTKTDFTLAGERYDIVFDVIGAAPFKDAVRTVRPGGRFLVGSPKMAHRMGRRWAERTRGVKVFSWSPGMSEANLVRLAELIRSGEIRPVIDRTYPLEQAAEAHAYAESGVKKGHIIITVA